MANAVITVLEADGVTETDVTVLDVGRQAAAASKSLALSTEDKTVLDSLATKLDTAITALQIIDNMVLAAGSANIGDVDVLTLPALVAGTANIGDVDVLTLPALPAGTNNIGDVDVLSVVPGTGATALGKAIDTATGATDTGVLALATRDDALTTLTPVDGDNVQFRTNARGAMWIDVDTGSEVAHDAADSGNGSKIAAKAVTSVSGLTMVANADRTDLFAGADGVLISRPHTNLEDIVTASVSNTDGASTEVLAAGAAGIKHYLTSIVVVNSSATDRIVEIKDGATNRLVLPVPANGGCVFNPPLPLEGTAATAWNFDPSAATTTMYCTMIAFKSKL